MMEPSERTPEYGRRLVNTFVTSMVVSGRELVINFNVSDETVNKNKKTSQTNLQKESSSGMRLVRLMFPQSNLSVTIFSSYFFLTRPLPL